MTDANSDSFLDEVAEAVRRDRLAQWFRRWGWAVALAVAAIIGAAAWSEWQASRAEAAAEARGEAVLAAIEAPDAAARLAALQALPATGDAGVVAALMLAAEQEGAGDAAAAVATLQGVAADPAVAPLWRDLAAFKALVLQGADADPAALEALAAPGAPFGLLAREQMALVAVERGDTAAAVETLAAIRDDAGVTPSQKARVEALLSALGAPAPADEAPAAELPAPADE